MLLTVLTIAEKTILLNWKSRENLNLAQFKNLLLDYVSMERMSARKKNKLAEFEYNWTPIIR